MISIIVPCYNEEYSIEPYLKATLPVISQLKSNYEILFVNDGSSDATLDKLKDVCQQNSNLKYINFSRNFGKEAALFAGLQNVSGDYVAVMDVDLQDPPQLLIEMYDKLEQNPNTDVVAARRTDRKGEPFLRSMFSYAFYGIMNLISDTHMPQGVRDFRLMRQPVVEALLSITEKNRFSKGLFVWVGFETEYIETKNIERETGTTSWSFIQLLKYSIDGVINFSERPLDLAIFTGLITCVLSVIGLIIILVKTLLYGDPTPGWPSMVSIIMFLSGIQLLSIGIVGKYISKIFIETKERPIYIIKSSNLPKNN